MEKIKNAITLIFYVIAVLNFAVMTPGLLYISIAIKMIETIERKLTAGKNE